MRHVAVGESDGVILWEFLAQAKPDEAVFVVTDHSFLVGSGPFVFRPSHCESFADAYQKATGECVMSGADMVFVCPESKLLVIFHHEGHAAIVR